MVAGTESAAQAAERRPLLTLFHGAPEPGKTTLALQLEADGVGVRICIDDWKDTLGLDLAAGHP